MKMRIEAATSMIVSFIALYSLVRAKVGKHAAGAPDGDQQVHRQHGELVEEEEEEEVERGERAVDAGDEHEEQDEEVLVLVLDLPGDQRAGEGDDAVEQDHRRGDAVDAEVQRDAVLAEEADVLQPVAADEELELLRVARPRSRRRRRARWRRARRRRATAIMRTRSLRSPGTKTSSSRREQRYRDQREESVSLLHVTPSPRSRRWRSRRRRRPSPARSSAACRSAGTCAAKPSAVGRPRRCR